MWNLLIDAAIAIGGYAFTDAVVKEKTGRHVHEHVFSWWCEMRDCIANWLGQNQKLKKINRVALVVLDKIDTVVVRTKKMADRMTIGIYALDAQNNDYVIETREVDTNELLKMFPDLKTDPVLVQQIAN